VPRGSCCLDTDEFRLLLKQVILRVVRILRSLSWVAQRHVQGKAGPRLRPGLGDSPAAWLAPNASTAVDLFAGAGASRREPSRAA
jgi:hypothetical protein